MLVIDSLFNTMTLFKNIFSTLVVLGVFALHPSMNKGETPITQLQHFVYGNTLNVLTNNSNDKNLIQVKWVCKVPNEKCQSLIVFKDGKQINEIPSKKGNQLLLVYYNNKVIGELPQYKTIANQSHQYSVELLSSNNSLFFKGGITGPSPYYGASVTLASL